MPACPWPRGLAPALVAIAAIWRVQQLVDAAGVAYETYHALTRQPRPQGGLTHHV